MSKTGDWKEHLRLVTPFLILVLGVYTSMVKSDIGRVENYIKGVDEEIKDVGDKIFEHLTNDDLHMPKTIAVTRAEFLIYQEMRDKQMDDVKGAVYDIRRLLQEHDEGTKRR